MNFVKISAVQGILYKCTSALLTLLPALNDIQNNKSARNATEHFGVGANRRREGLSVLTVGNKSVLTRKGGTSWHFKSKERLRAVCALCHRARHLQSSSQIWGRWKRLSSGWRQVFVQTTQSVKYRSALFWDIMQRIVATPYRRFGTSYQYHLQGSRNPRIEAACLLGFLPLKMGRTGCPETAVIATISCVISQKSACII